MAKPKLPPADRWDLRDIKDWNTNTFLQYLRDKHEEKYQIPYTYAKGGIMMEKGMLKHFMDKNGKDITKQFIDTCFTEHRPNPNYPGVNFWFMKTYMEATTLPRLHAKQQNQKKAEKREQEQPKMSVQDMLDKL